MLPQQDHTGLSRSARGSEAADSALKDNKKTTNNMRESALSVTEWLSKCVKLLLMTQNYSQTGVFSVFLCKAFMHLLLFQCVKAHSK